MDNHSKLSPSSAERWMACPGSVALIDSMDLRPKQSFYANEGSAAHELAAFCLKHGNNAGDYVGSAIRDTCITPEMAAAVNVYRDYINGMNGYKFYEKRVSYENYITDGFGTADCIVINNDRLDIIDFKYGRGVKVTAIENKQLMLYALGALNGLDKTRLPKISIVGLSIVQPRIIRQKTPYTAIFECSTGFLKIFGEKARTAGLAAMDADAPRIPGNKQCRWCDAHDICPEYSATKNGTIKPLFDVL